jgi:hypothetical protein
MVRRTALLTGLEHYRREKVLTEYESEEWFRLPTDRWEVRVRSEAVDRSSVSDPALKDRLQTEAAVLIVVDTLSTLSASGAVPRRMDLSA